MRIEMEVSEELIDKLITTGVLELADIRDSQKIADALKEAVFNHPDDRLFFDREAVASAIEEFMFERGEYDYTRRSDVIRWVAEDGNRTTTEKNILNALCDGEMGGHEALMDYLKDEIATMDEADELLVSAKTIVLQMEGIPAIFKDEVIEEWGKQALLDCNYGDTTIQILPAGYDDYIRTETIKAAFERYCDNTEGCSTFSAYLENFVCEKTFNEIGTDLEYELLESIKEKASERSEDFAAALELYIDGRSPNEVMEVFGYEGFTFDLTDFLKNNYRFNLMMATENELNFDSCSLMQCYGDIPSTAKLSETDFQKYADNALSYLIQQQGHTIEEAMNVMAGTEKTKNEFINSIRDEVESHSYDMGLLTVCVSVYGQEVLDVLDAIASKEQNLKFSEQTNLCIHDKWNGSTSAIEVTLENDAVFPSSMVHEVQFESTGRDDLVAQVSHEWTVNEVCDLIGSVWTDGSVKVTDEAPVLMQENLAETQKQVASAIASLEKSNKQKEIVDD